MAIRIQYAASLENLQAAFVRSLKTAGTAFLMFLNNLSPVSHTSLMYDSPADIKICSALAELMK